jgi:hypothetical protein
MPHPSEHDNGRNRKYQTHESTTRGQLRANIKWELSVNTISELIQTKNYAQTIFEHLSPVDFADPSLHSLLLVQLPCKQKPNQLIV